MKRFFQSRFLTVFKVLLVMFLATLAPQAQDWQVVPTWLHRYVPQLNYAQVDLVSPTCHYKAIFGEGDPENRIMLSVARFGEATLDAGGNCQMVEYGRQEELYFVMEGKGALHYGDQTYPMRAHDFTYLPPGVKHFIANTSPEPLRVVVMTFKIPSSLSIGAPPAEAKIVNMDDVKEETVEGHPTSVLYKLLAGPRTGTHDAIDQAYVVVSLFWMDFAPGGTNFPHHHQAAEENISDRRWYGGNRRRRGHGWCRRPSSGQNRGCVLLSAQLHGGVLQREETGRQGAHPGSAIAHSVTQR